MDLLSVAIVECIMERLPGVIKIVPSYDGGVGAILVQRGKILGLVDNYIVETNNMYNKVLFAITSCATPVIVVENNNVWCGTHNNAFNVHIDPHSCRFQDTIDTIVREYNYYGVSLINGV